MVAQGGLKRGRAIARACKHTLGACADLGVTLYYAAARVARTVDAKRHWDLPRQLCTRHAGPWCDYARQVGKQPRDRTDARRMQQAQVYPTVDGSTRRRQPLTDHMTETVTVKLASATLCPY